LENIVQKKIYLYGVYNIRCDTFQYIHCISIYVHYNVDLIESKLNKFYVTLNLFLNI